MRPSLHFLSIITLIVFLDGCYTTSVMTSAPRLEAQSDKQWFFLWGAIGLSNPSGRECGVDGVAQAVSQTAFSDMLLSLVLGLASGYAASTFCDGVECKTAAFSGGFTVSSILNTRTVTYACRKPGHSSRPNSAGAQQDGQDDDESGDQQPKAPPARTPKVQKSDKSYQVSPPARVVQSGEPPSPKLECVTNSDCRESAGCANFGRCVSGCINCPATGDNECARCVAVFGAHCKQSRICRKGGKCTPLNGECVK